MMNPRRLFLVLAAGILIVAASGVGWSVRGSGSAEAQEASTVDITGFVRQSASFYSGVTQVTPVTGAPCVGTRIEDGAQVLLGSAFRVYLLDSAGTIEAVTTTGDAVFADERVGSPTPYSGSSVTCRHQFTLSAPADLAILQFVIETDYQLSSPIEPYVLTRDELMQVMAQPSGLEFPEPSSPAE